MPSHTFLDVKDAGCMVLRDWFILGSFQIPSSIIIKIITKASRIKYLKLLGTDLLQDAVTEI